LITQNLGSQGEQKALTYLKEQGLRLVKQNYSCKTGEIDLIMLDGAYLVFIEVRLRAKMQFGGGIASITRPKKQRIMRATQYFLMQQGWHDKYPVRFDVLSLDGAEGTITWIKDAFGVDY
jgi:putative endonuclease